MRLETSAKGSRDGFGMYCYDKILCVDVRLWISGDGKGKHGLRFFFGLY